MAQTVNVNFRMDPVLKKNMEETCQKLGLSMTTAFTIFAKKVTREKRIPFEVSVEPFCSERNIRYLAGIASGVAAGRAFHADACLMGTAGLLGTSGPTSHSWSQLSLKQAMCQSAARVYVLADSSKFRDTGLHEWVLWDVIDGLVTDAGLCQEDQDRLSGKVEILQGVSAEEM